MKEETMKRGKDDGKTIEPMFPRLHVNDTEKGWPRAPPRNKMALYEQFSVPSTRLSSGILPLNGNNSSNSVPAPSSSQGTGTDGNLVSPLNLTLPTPPNQVGKSQALPGGANVNPTFVQLEQTTEVGDEDDFTVPVYIQSRMGKNKVQNGSHREKLTSSGIKHFDGSTKLQTGYDKSQVHFATSSAHLRPEVANGRKVSDNSRVHSAKSTKDLSSENAKSTKDLSRENAKSSKDLSRENIEGLLKEANISANQGFQEKSNMSFDKSRESDVCLQQHSRSSVRLDDSGFVDDVVESTRDGEVDNVPCSIGDSNAMKKNGKLNVPADNLGNNADRTYSSIQVGNVDKSDIVSENSMVDSIPALDVCPDDIVGVIGLKHFWKARRAIINREVSKCWATSETLSIGFCFSQQRVFEVQVFELHRLIKVQQLIAGSPHLLLEEGVFLDNSSPSPLPVKKLRSDYNVKSQVQLKQSDDPKKPNHNVECSAENAVGKTSIPSAPIGCQQPSSNGPYSVNPQPTPVAADNKLSSWYQTSAHHWLVPVMSPSEGLVFKPYPSPSFICGGYGPYGSIMNPSYGFPAAVHQGIGSLPSTTTPMVGGTYFPPFGMPVMNPGASGLGVDQLNWYTGQTNQLSGGVAASNVQQQTSYDLSTQRNEDNETVPQTLEFQAPKRNEVQVSTASSPADKVQGNGSDRISDSRDVLPLFPVAPALVDEGPQPSGSNPKKRVIRVVPHNRRSANESAARIFQSIQNERKQYDSI